MKFIMDMVHDNPGQERFKTEFRKPEKLLDFGYNTQVFRQNNTTVTFDRLGEDFFCEEGGHEWLEKMTKLSVDEIFPAHEAGLMTMCHIDLFVLPKLLAEKYKDEICDEDGRISIYREKTKELHRIMFDEMFERYPIDGLIIRVGETYLHDTPFHIGNGAVKYGVIEDEKNEFAELINFLREEVCIKHGKFLVFRTWDCFFNRFHSSLEYYLDVTNRIEPCDKLIFSIKHTVIDFYRNIKFNPCIGEGIHKQVIEVQCQREYEGKGAYPMYNMNGVINGFPEMKYRKGIKDFANNPLVCGIFGWSRGGGWNGPYIKNEFWCDLNAFVICKYAQEPNRNERDLFFEYCTERMGLDNENSERFYEMCLRVSDAVLHGRYITPYDKSLNESGLPCANWLRDDQIAPLSRLNPIFDYLEENNLVQEAIDEKELSVRIWNEIRDKFDKIEIENKALKEFISNSIEYGLRFYSIINIVFRIYAKCRKNENVKDLLEKYDDAWTRYLELEKRNQASSSFSGERFEGIRGVDETIEFCRENLA